MGGLALLAAGAAGIAFALWDVLGDRRFIAGFWELVVWGLAVGAAWALISVSILAEADQAAEPAPGIMEPRPPPLDHSLASWAQPDHLPTLP